MPTISDPLPPAPIPAMGAISGVDLSAMDIETALMYVQTQRANLIETQLKDQMVSVQKRNTDIERLNSALAELRRVRPTDDTTDTYVNSGGMMFTMPTSAYPAGGVIATSANGADTVNVNATGLLEAYGITATGSTLKQAQIDQLISTVTAKIDSLNSSQQMDMLRLQSLTNKRNEAYDVMTNFMKKSQDARSSIVSNMR
jgi:chaperonin cofactor prefoldin